MIVVVLMITIILIMMIRAPGSLRLRFAGFVGFGFVGFAGFGFADLVGLFVGFGFVGFVGLGFVRVLFSVGYYFGPSPEALRRFVSWRGLTGEYLLVILVTLVVTLGIWLFCQCRFLYALQSTSRDHWHSLVSLYGQSASQHRPYLEPAYTDDETQTVTEPSSTLRHRLPRKSHNKMPDFQDNESQTFGFDYEHQLTRCTLTSTDDWKVWTPWVYLVRQLMRVRRRQPLFYSNGVQLQRVTRYLLDGISDANMTIGPGGPIDHEVTRWTASGMAQILDQSPEAAFTEAREKLRLYQSGAGRYSDVVITRDIIRLHQAGLGRYVTDGSSPVSKPARQVPESATPQAAPPASSADVAPPWSTPSATSP